MNSYYSEPALSVGTAAAGDRLAPLVKRPTQVDVVLFCAAIRNFHRFHYDQDYTRAQGMNDLIVPGFMMGNWCLEAASRAFGEPVHIRRLTFKNTAAAPIGGSYAIHGHVVSVETNEAAGRIVHCGFEVIGGGDRPVTTGTAALVSTASGHSR
ncbi:hypothetical protein [Hoeflea poritis]|uniref:Acyl dehydratase n=1 Tax=Hoeflea poritis TaxID=2993659 RepID=A0ABT4VJS5_9HYPH|nr:hypothetical protein [Hoeflea poritis]MDA4844395.1 hypothetical protein [Hoeflea poritis]